MRGARLNSLRSPESAIAWVFVALLHAVIVWIVSRPVIVGPGIVGSPLEVVFIQRLRAKPQPAAKVAPAHAEQLRTDDSQIANATASRVVMHTPAQSSLPLMVGDDTWDQPKTSPADGVSLAQNPLMSSYNPRPRPAPGMFRMRRQISAEDIVRGASQVLGFWPPGYTDDPCAGLGKAVEMLAEGTTTREHRLLADAVEQQERYCKRVGS